MVIFPSLNNNVIGLRMPRKTALMIATVCTVALTGLGLVLIYSATHQEFGAEYMVRQALYLLVAGLTGLAIAILPRGMLSRYRWLIYGSGIILLIFTLIVGVRVRGQISWLDFFWFRLQTSEVMKPILLITWANLTARMQVEDFGRGSTLLMILTLGGLPAGLILLQGDMGTTLIYLAFMGGWLFLSGFWREGIALISLMVGAVIGLFVRVFGLMPDWLSGGEVNLGFQGRTMMVFIGLLILLVAVVVVYYWLRQRLPRVVIPLVGVLALLGGFLGAPNLADHHIRRLEVFLNPYQAPLETGYNIIQSQIALGSGGLWGQGYLQGSQSQLGFIPELWTDFIYTVAVEELGMITGLAIIGLYVVCVYCLFSAAVLAPDWVSFYYCAGAGLLISLHTAVNLGVAVGVLPVMGIPLLFVSYGGSSLVMAGILLGLSWRTLRRRTGQAFRQKRQADNSVFWFWKTTS